jgi:4-hydroxybenzoate polyprenyltransferase
MSSVLRLLRPVQWLKNFFIFAPLIFSKHLFDGAYLFSAGQAFVVFALLSSTVYIFNDIADRELDRLHPTKRNRPIAAGKISISQAIGIAVVLLVIIGLLVTKLNAKFLFIASVYFVLNIGYSFFLKQVILVDVFIVAAGFMLRVLAGAFAINVQVSEWLVLCTLFVSLFLSISKRRAELMMVKNTPGFEGRPVLREYDVEFLDQMMTVAASGVAISYALYTVAERTISVFGTSSLIFTTVFVLFGIFRYLYLVRVRKTEDNPTYMLTTDLVTILNIVAWFAVCVIIIYFTEIKAWIGVR